VTEIRFFEEGIVPEWTTPQWYAGRETAPHLEQPGHRERLLRTAEIINELNPASVVDLGAGDGGLLSLLTCEEAWGYDLQQTNIEVARTQRNVDVSLVDVVSNPGCIDTAHLAVATEMLEHLIDPHGFVRWVYSWADVFVASSPWNEVDGDHYEFHTWAWDMEGFRAMFEAAGYSVSLHEKVQGAQLIVGVR
jgi:predicted RNA methylase